MNPYSDQTTVETIINRTIKNNLHLFKSKDTTVFVKYNKNSAKTSAQHLIDTISNEGLLHDFNEDHGILFVSFPTHEAALSFKNLVNDLYKNTIPAFYKNEFYKENWLTDALHNCDFNIGFEDCDIFNGQKLSSIGKRFYSYNINYSLEQDKLKEFSLIDKDDYLSKFADMIMDNSTLFTDKDKALTFLNKIYENRLDSDLYCLSSQHFSTSTLIYFINKSFITNSVDFITNTTNNEDVDTKMISQYYELKPNVNLKSFIIEKENIYYDFNKMHELINPQHTITPNDFQKNFEFDYSPIDENVNSLFFNTNNGHMQKIPHNLQKTVHIISSFSDTISRFITIQKLYSVHNELFKISNKVINPENYSIDEYKNDMKKALSF